MLLGNDSTTFKIISLFRSLEQCQPASKGTEIVEDTLGEELEQKVKKLHQKFLVKTTFVGTLVDAPKQKSTT